MNQSAANVRTAALGEELPIFCEKCGYSLVGLPQMNCDHCGILQFHCPECGHHQHINTLRPAFQKTLGRIRAGWLTLVIFLKLNFFGWGLFFWCVLGNEFSRYRYNTGYRIDYETIMGFSIYAALFAFFGRLLLLRWANGAVVGLVIAGLILAAALLGVQMRAMNPYWASQRLLSRDFTFLLTMAACVAVLSSAAAWTIWSLLVKAFLPRATSQSLLEWQRKMSVKEVAALSKQE